MTRKQANAKEKKHLDSVASLCCIVCGVPKVELHHCINIGNKKRDHFRVIPLCADHHRGTFSIHMARKPFREKYGHEEDLLLQVERMLELRKFQF